MNGAAKMPPTEPDPHTSSLMKNPTRKLRQTAEPVRMPSRRAPAFTNNSGHQMFVYQLHQPVHGTPWLPCRNFFDGYLIKAKL